MDLHGESQEGMTYLNVIAEENRRAQNELKAKAKAATPLMSKRVTTSLEKGL